MCFTPKISLSTAMIEFVVSVYIYLKYSKSVFAKFVALFIFILGFYQFTEFMLCTSDNVQLWGKLGFITYTILPALGVHFVLIYGEKQFIKKILSKIILYSPMIIFILIAIFDNNFVISGSCSRFFVSIKNYFHNSAVNPWASSIYLAYYYFYMVTICVVLMYRIMKYRKKHLTIVYAVILATTLLAITPPLVLVIIFPTISHQFPSVYCQFALLYAIFAIVGVYFNDKFERKQ